MPKLTKRRVDAAGAQAREYFLWDEEVPGFGLRVLPSGRKSYVVQYRAGRRPRRMSLGPSTVLTCEQARDRAITIVAAVRNGQDPAAQRDARRTAATVKELAERFDREHIAIRLKPSTAKEYRGNLKRFILPVLGRLAVTEVTRADVAKFHHDLRHIPYQANRCLEVISKMFNLAEMWGLRPDGTNPRKHIRKYPEEKRERFLSAAELRRVGEVMREMEDEGIQLPSAIAAVRLLILTGCRLGEIMTLKWEHVDIPGNAEAEERRLMPLYVEDYFVKACEAIGLKVEPRADGLWRVEHVLADLRSDRLQAVRRLGKPDAAYRKITFRKNDLDRDQHLDAVLVGPGHPLYAAVDERLSGTNAAAVAADRSRWQPAA